MLEEKLNALVSKQATDNIAYQIEYQGNVYSYRNEHIFRSASITKIPLCLSALKKGELLDENPTLDVSRKVMGSGVLHSMEDTITMTLHDLVTIALIVSDNTASNVLMDYVGFDQMSKDFKAWGLKDTELKSHYMNMNADPNKMYNIATASGMMTALNLIYEDNEYISQPIRDRMKRLLRQQQFNDRVGGTLDDGGQENHITVSSKSGTIDKLEHDVGIFKMDKTILKFAVLSQGWPTNLDGRQFLIEVGHLLKAEMEQ